MPTQDVQHIRRMRGGCAESSHALRRQQLLRRDVPEQPSAHPSIGQRRLGTRLAEVISLPVPVAVAEVEDVHPWLIEHSPELRIEPCGRQTMITSGPSFGSRYAVPPTEGEVYDYLLEAMTRRVRNLSNFAGILASDKWTCNADGRQAAFWKRRGERKFTASLIDQGYCFNAGNGVFRMHRCEASLDVRTSTQASLGGRALNPG